MKTIEPINLSPSFLSKVLKSGYDLSVGEKLGLVEKETASMSEGKIMHSYLSGVYGGKVEKVAISPFSDFRTKEARAWRDQQPDDTFIIKEEQAEKFQKIAERVKAHPEMVKLIGDSKVETEKRVVKKVGDYTLKGFVDLITDTNIVFDFKYLNTKNFDNFHKFALWEHYDMQAAIYDTIVGSTNVYFVVIESEAPHRIKVWQVSLSAFESGGDKFNRAMMIIKQENWRSPTFDIQGVSELQDWSY